METAYPLAYRCFGPALSRGTADYSHSFARADALEDDDVGLPPQDAPGEISPSQELKPIEKEADEISFVAEPQTEEIVEATSDTEKQATPPKEQEKLQQEGSAFSPKFSGTEPASAEGMAVKPSDGTAGGSKMSANEDMPMEAAEYAVESDPESGRFKPTVKTSTEVEHKPTYQRASSESIRAFLQRTFLPNMGCPTCESIGKEMFVNTERDLHNHMMRKHQMSNEDSLRVVHCKGGHPTTCPWCGISSNSRTLFLKHVFQRHRKEYQKEAGDPCGKRKCKTERELADTLDLFQSYAWEIFELFVPPDEEEEAEEETAAEPAEV